MSGVRSVNLTSASLVDELIGHRDGSTVRIALARLVALISAVLGPAHATRAELLADLDWPEGAQGYVRGDPTVGYNGVYRKSGASGAGTWERIGDLPSGAVEAMQLAALEAAVSVRAALVHSHSVGQIDGLAAELDALVAQLLVVTAGLATKAPLASPALTGTPTTPTAAPGTNTAQIASTAFVRAALDALVAAAPGTLDTLNELAAALGGDANFAATVTAALAAKAPLANPALTGTPTAPTAAPGTNTAQIASTAFVRAALDALVAAAPGTLDTLNELAAALGGDANFAATVTAALAARAPLTALTAEEARARAAEALIASRARPGDLASAFAPDLTGTVTATTPYTYGDVAGDTDLGAVLRLTGATHAALRAAVAVEPGRVYQARWVWRRATDPADPAGDTVEVGVRWLTETMAGLAGGSGNRLVQSATLTVAMGVQRRSATFSLDVPGTDYTIPAGTRYARPWCRTYGTDHATHIGTVEIVDITEAWAAQAAGTAAAGSVTAEAAARVAADAGLAAQIAGKAATVHGHSVGQVEGLAAELDALIAQLLVVTGLATAAVTQAQLSARVGADGAPVDTAGTWFYRGVEVVWGVGDPDGRGGIALGADGYLRGRLPLLAGLNGINFAEGADGLYRLTLGTVEGQLPLAGGQVIDTTEDRWFRGRAVDMAISDSAGLPGLVVCTDGAVALGDGDLCEPRTETLYYEGDAVERAEVDRNDRPWKVRLADGRTRMHFDARDLAPFLPDPVPPRILSFGDSLTEGTGGGGTTTTSQLALLTGLEAYNYGIGGQNSTPIAMRLGGTVGRVTVPGNEITSGANTITAIDSVTLSTAGGMAGDTGRIYPFPLSTAAGNSTRTAKVMIQGVTGTLTRTASGGPPSTTESYTFTPDAGSVLPVTCPPGSPMRVVSPIRAGDWVPLWIGRNDNQLVSVILDNIRACVAYIRARGAHPVILTTINGNYASEFAGGANYLAFVDTAAALEDEFPVETLDIRRLLISQGLARAGITPTAQDLIDIANDIIPSSLRSDNIHLNAAGYAVVAELIHEHMIARGFVAA